MIMNVKFKPKTLAISIALATTSLSPLAVSTASAQWSTSANITLASEQSFRGRSQTNEKAALYGSLDLGHSSGFYAGVWGSNRSYAGGLELDLYAGFAKNGFNIGYVQYVSPNDAEFTAGNDGIGADFGELYLKYSFNGFTIGAALSSDWFGEQGDAQNFSIDWSKDIAQGLNLALHLGTNSFDDIENFDHEDYAITISKTLTSNYSAFAQFTGTNLEGRDDSQDGRLILGVKAGF